MKQRIAEIAGFLFIIIISSSVLGRPAWAADGPLSDGDTGSVTYPSSFESFKLEADLELPDDVKDRVPAMIIVHGTAGVAYREKSWADFFQDQGIASMVIDYFGPRGIDKDSRHKPEPPFDVVDAFKALLSHPKIDPDRIGVIGFSRGAGMALTTANFDANMTGGHAFAAHVSLYPAYISGYSITNGGSKAPIMLMLGTKDSYTTVKGIKKLQKQGLDNGRQVDLKIYEGAYHMWDADKDGRYTLTNGAVVEFRPDWEVTKQSRKDVMEFLKGPLKLEK